MDLWKEIIVHDDDEFKVINELLDDSSDEELEKFVKDQSLERPKLLTNIATLLQYGFISSTSHQTLSTIRCSTFSKKISAIKCSLQQYNVKGGRERQCLYSTERLYGKTCLHWTSEGNSSTTNPSIWLSLIHI